MFILIFITIANDVSSRYAIISHCIFRHSNNWNHNGDSKFFIIFKDV